ncbi:MAG: prepilin-type N-terminal cleavage/methylation domain-containing protein [Desulfohalobiaceae bacterium]|nr:prepilin-type N-terminal cleavage/methylation domain-containing protein [Desulfohalobiaceae bacterium]
MQGGRDSSQGFTLLELLVTMGILLIVITAAYQSYTRLLRGFVAESSSAEAQMEAVVNTNLLRLDIAHAGYGLARNLSNPPLEWSNSNRTLTIRSTVDNLEEATLGWILCSNGTRVQDNDDAGLGTYVFLNSNEQFVSFGNTNCTAGGINVGYPYDTSDSQVTPPGAGCTNQPCYRITYTLSSSTQSLEKCADGTSNLQRTTDPSPFSGGVSWRPVINCVADWQVAFEQDTNGDGSMDTVTTSSVAFSPANATQVEQVHVYALVQEGSYERDYTFSGSTSMDGVTLNLPGTSEADHYRWKMMKLSVKPQDL